MAANTNDEENDFVARDYQIDLLEQACQNNIIIPLGTGTGKTFIAALLIREFAESIVIPWKRGGKRAIFIVDKVALVQQQAAHIEQHTSLSVGRIHGHLNMEVASDISLFEKFIAEKQVIVITAAVFLELLDHAFFDFKRAAVVVIDECHHALGYRHPYRLILHRHQALPENGRPRILGLTASVINSKTEPAKMESCLSVFEKVMHSTLASTSNYNTLLKYEVLPRLFITSCANFDEIKFKNVVDSLVELKEFCRRCRDFHPEFDIDSRQPLIDAAKRALAVLRNLGPWCAYRICQIFEKRIKAFSRQRILPAKQALLLQMGRTVIRRVLRLLQCEAVGAVCYADLKPHLPDRVVRVLDLLMNYKPASEETKEANSKLSGIIFVEQRYVAFALHMLITTLATWNRKEFGFIKCNYMIGYNSCNIGLAEARALHTRQEEVLRDFRNRQLNLLVSTSVLEEGVDISHCNCVIRFDRPRDYRSFIQSRGRAREKGGEYIILVEKKEHHECVEDIKNFMEIERVFRYLDQNFPYY